MKKGLLLFLFFLIVIIDVNANSAPVFNESKTREIHLKEYQYFNYSLKANDTDNDPLTFIDLANLTNFKSFKMNSSGHISFSVGYNDIGYYPVMLIVRDPSYDANIITWNFNITNSSNVPPSVIYEPGLEQTIDENKNINFNVNVTDNNNDILTSRWLLDAVEKSNNAHNFIYQSSYDSSGIHNVIFEVNDGNVSTFVKWNITVINVDLVPYLIKPIENITIYQSSDYSFNLIDYFKDDDGDKLNYSIDKVDNVNININNETGEVLIMPNEDFIGERSLIFKALDASHSISSNTVNLTVNQRSESSRNTFPDSSHENRDKNKQAKEQTSSEESNKITGQTVNVPKENKIIETILEKAGFNSEMFKKPNISWGIIGSLIIIGILVIVWIKIRINRRKHFGF